MLAAREPTRLQRLVVVAALAGATAWLLTITGCNNTSAPLRLGYTTEEPSHSVAQALVAVLANQQPPIVLEVPFQSVEELTAALEGGAIDLAMLEEPITPNPYLRALMPLYPSVLHAIYRYPDNAENITTADHNQPPSLQTLLGSEPIYAGPIGSIGHKLVRKLTENYGIAGIDTRLRDNPWQAPPATYFIFGGLLSTEARAGFRNYRLFSFAEQMATGEQSVATGPANAIALQYPNLRPFILPLGIYPEIADQAIHTLAVETLLVGRPSLDAEWVYAAVETLRAHPQSLEQAYPLARETFTQPVDASLLTLALHEGTRRYIDKDAPTLLERYAELLALCATLLIGVGTVAAGWLRRRRQRRKDRLDAFFLRLQSARRRLSIPSISSAELFAEVAVIEDEVLALLVDERIEVDSALVAFFIMANGLRHQIEEQEPTASATL